MIVQPTLFYMHILLNIPDNDGNVCRQAVFSVKSHRICRQKCKSCQRSALPGSCDAPMPPSRGDRSSRRSKSSSLSLLLLILRAICCIHFLFLSITLPVPHFKHDKACGLISYNAWRYTKRYLM